MTPTRNDIAIGVTAAGEVYVTQGVPAWRDLAKKGLACFEKGLYYSQIRHRVAWVDRMGEYHIGTPTEASKADVFDLVTMFRQVCAGRPLYQGHLVPPDISNDIY